MDKTTDEQLKKNLVNELVSTYDGGSGTNFIDVKNLPVREKILEVIDALKELLFPGYAGRQIVTKDNVSSFVEKNIAYVRSRLTEQIELALRHHCRLKACPAHDCNTMAWQVTEEFLHKIPKIRQYICGDVLAAYEGDPAAKSLDEVVISYPFITAISIYRISHELYLDDIPLIPRIMSEYAHEKTGIDIHPGAKIGKNFFIDHGTGVVIGETAVVGDNVKIYQGVTLGAMSFPKDEKGRIIKGGKRHPTIEDGVTIYAEATILGDITIGKGSVIGGNVWIKQSVPPGVTVSMKNQDLKYTHREGKPFAGGDKHH